MTSPAVFAATFLAAAVEITEMVIIVAGVGAVRGWRSALPGAGAGLAVVAALILALGTATSSTYSAAASTRRSSVSAASAFVT
jgi:uncharacterized membrane protein